jgi:hypothetical protein
MLNNIIFIASGLVIGILIMYVQKFIKKQASKVVLDNISPEDKAKFEDLYNKGLLTLKEVQKYLPELKSPEAWDGTKFVKGMSNISSAKKWGEEIHNLFNIRKLVIYGVLIGVIFGYGFWKGQQGKDVHFDLRGKEAIIKLNEHYLKIEKDGTAKVIDKDGKVVKIIKVSDIPALSKALRPYGFILEPIAVAGIGMGKAGTGVEAGVGASLVKYYKWKLDAFLTQRGIYAGTSYSITDNFGTGIAVGKGFAGDSRVMIYGRWKF